MKISIVVPAFNEEVGLAATLGSISRARGAFDRRGWTAELIVCDNNSTDSTAAVARNAGALVVFEPLNQIGRARNTGAAHATGDWLIFVDADSHPSVALFDAVAAEIQRGRCLAGGSTVTYGRQPLFVSASTWGWNLWSRLSRWAAGSFIFCEAAAFRETGGFCLELFALEEIDLFRRLKRVARRRGRTIAILHRHPLVTSDRKLHLYSGRDLAALLMRAAASPRRTIRSPEHCFVWYDGRR